MSNDTPPETPFDYGVERALQTGPRTWVSFIVDHDENQVGVIEWHDCADKLVGCGVYFDNDAGRELFPDRARWTVESHDPLTLSPSILCKRCGHHGYIRNGQWVPA